MRGDTLHITSPSVPPPESWGSQDKLATVEKYPTDGAEPVVLVVGILSLELPQRVPSCNPDQVSVVTKTSFSKNELEGNLRPTASSKVYGIGSRLDMLSQSCRIQGCFVVAVEHAEGLGGDAHVKGRLKSILHDFRHHISC